MDLNRLGELTLSFQHRHGDGSLGRFERVASDHDVADHDPERDWGKGTLYRCTTCDEEIVVAHEEDTGTARG
jgi:hypothetical protein